MSNFHEWLAGWGRNANPNEVRRKRVIYGFRQLADLLEQNPNMLLPHEGTIGRILFMCDSKEAFAATVKAFGRGHKEDGGDTLDFLPEAFPLPVKVLGYKSSICQKRTVTRMVEAHEETVEEYVCPPFLEGAPK